MNLVQHVNCELANAYANVMFSAGNSTKTSAQEQALWHKLYEDNFVAAVDFEL